VPKGRGRAGQEPLGLFLGSELPPSLFELPPSREATTDKMGGQDGGQAGCELWHAGEGSGSGQAFGKT